MASYLILGKYTSQGVQNIKDSPKRLEAAHGQFRKHGAEMKAFYLALGRFDFVARVDAPDDAAVAKAVLGIAAGGAVATETLRLFEESEYREIVGAL